MTQYIERTLGILRTYISPSAIEHDAQILRFTTVPNIVLHLTFTGPYRGMPFQRWRDLSEPEKDDITERFVAESARWVSALRSLPGIGNSQTLNQS
jgi:hypothetical protein